MTELVELSGAQELVSGKYDKILSIDPRRLSDFDAGIWALKIFSIMVGPDITWNEALSDENNLSGDPRLAGWFTNLKKTIKKAALFVGNGGAQKTVETAMRYYRKGEKSQAAKILTSNPKNDPKADVAAVDEVGKGVKEMFAKVPKAVWWAGGSILALIIGVVIVNNVRS